LCNCYIGDGFNVRTEEKERKNGDNVSGRGRDEINLSVLS
jgi:hypothetical protein